LPPRVYAGRGDRRGNDGYDLDPVSLRIERLNSKSTSRFIIFLRHGQALNNVERVLAGRTPDVPLTETGIAQSERIARFLEPFRLAAIYSSPIKRATNTAEIVAKHNALDYQVDERLIELDMGKLTGMGYDEIFDQHGDLFHEFFDGGPKVKSYGIETFPKVKERVSSMVQEVIEKHPDENVVLVTHAEPIKAMLATILRASPSSLYELRIETGSLTVFKESGGTISLAALNLMDAHSFSHAR